MNTLREKINFINKKEVTKMLHVYFRPKFLVCLPAVCSESQVHFNMITLKKKHLKESQGLLESSNIRALFLMYIFPNFI